MIVARNPALGVLTSGYGPRTPIFIKEKGVFTASFHAGQDIAGSVGTKIRAAITGVVVYAGAAGVHPLTQFRTGLCVIIRNDAIDTYYGHLNTIGVRVGQSVTAGDTIGTMGMTGNSTGPHLHFEVRDANTLVTRDPKIWAKTVGVTLGSEDIVDGFTDTDRYALNLILAATGRVEASVWAIRHAKATPANVSIDASLVDDLANALITAGLADKMLDSLGRKINPADR